MDSFSPPSAETIRSWADAEGAALERIRSKIRELQAEEATLVVRLKALQDMLGTFGPSPASAATEVAAAPSVAGRALAEAPREPLLRASEDHRGGVGLRIRAQVAEILSGQSKPMHINDIWAEFKRRGWGIPGRGNPANITAHLTGAVEIVSPTRGYYALAEQVITTSGKEAPEVAGESKAHRGQSAPAS